MQVKESLLWKGSFTFLKNDYILQGIGSVRRKSEKLSLI